MRTAMKSVLSVLGFRDVVLRADDKCPMRSR